MNNKGILVLNYLDKQRKLNYVTYEGDLLVITSGQSNKVAYMKDHDQVELQFGEEIVKAKPHIISNPKEVQKLFDVMNAEDNNHFKAFNDMFVAIKFSLNK
ncbi:MAG: hypothetical protein WCR19_03625 [Acholeplasmataceae bacterium]